MGEPEEAGEGCYEVGVGEPEEAGEGCYEVGGEDMH